MEASLISSKPGALDPHSTKRTHRHMTIRLTVPGTSPMFQLDEFRRSSLHKQLDHILISQPVSAGDRILHMVFEAIILFDDPGSAALGGYRVTAHRIDFRNDRDVELRVCLSCSDCCTQSCSSTADNEHIMYNSCHGPSY